MREMLNSFTITAAIFAILFGCAAIGARLRERIPGDHLGKDTKDMVMVGVGLLVTMSSLALSLLLSEAKSRFDTLSTQVRDAAVKVALLDDDLKTLGSPAEHLRTKLHGLVEARVNSIWSSGLNATAGAPRVAATQIAEFRRALAKMQTAGTDVEQARTGALQLVEEFRQMRFLMDVDQSSDIVLPVLALIVFWMAVVLLALNVFSPRNGTITAINLLGALAVAGAMFLILEMNEPFGGLIHVSSKPLQIVLSGMQK